MRDAPSLEEEVRGNDYDISLLCRWSLYHTYDPYVSSYGTEVLSYHTVGLWVYSSSSSIR